MNGDFFKSQWRLLIFGAGVVIVLLGFLIWHSYTNPKAVFNDMLVNNLSTRSVTKNQVVSSSSENDVQRVTIIFGPQYVARSLVTVQNTSGSVTTETLATPKNAYLRYASISDSSKKKDYSSLVNVWAKAGSDSNGTQLRQVFNNSILDISAAPLPPIGYVDGAKRGELLDYMHQQAVFMPDYKSIKNEVINGRKVYTYSVTVKLAPYLRLMQEFADTYALKDLQDISPNEYQSATLKLNISVDKLSHQMVRVASATLGLNETYSDYGLTKAIPLPIRSVSVSQLQAKLKAIR